MAGRPAQDWLTTPLHRNSFTSPLFLHAVWGGLIASWLQNNAGVLVVVTESAGLARTLQQLAAERQTFCRLIGHEKFSLTEFATVARASARMILDALHMLLRISLARAILGARHIARLTGSEILIDTYLSAGDIRSDGRFRDRYFPGLIEWYQAQNRNAAAYPFLNDIPWRGLGTVYRGMRRSSVPLAPFELFLRYRDVLAAVLACLRAATRRTSLLVPRCFGLDIQPMMAPLSISSAMRALYPLLLFKAPARMAKQGIRPRYYIDWFENQVIDKATVLGFRRTGHTCEVIAARPYIPYPNALSLFSSPGEMLVGAGPVRNWVCGNALPRIFERFGPGADYRLVPSLRYDYLYRQSPAKPGGGNACLVMLTHSPSESLNILMLMKQGVSALIGQVDAVIIKPHPALRKETLHSLFTANDLAVEGAVPIRWSDVPLGDLLQEARLLVTAGSSSAVEAVCYGLPVILAGMRAGLDYLPLEDIDPRMWRVVYDHSELAAAIGALLDDKLSPVLRIEIGRDTKERFFLPAARNMGKYFPDQT